MLDGLDRWLTFAGPDASGLLGGCAALAVAAGLLVIPAHLALVWAGGDRMMRFIALTAVLALGLALAVSQAIALALGAPFPVGVGQMPAIAGPGPFSPGDLALAFFTYATVLAVFGHRGIARIMAGIGLVVAGAELYLGRHTFWELAVAAVIGVCAAAASVWVMARAGARVLGELERVSGLVGRALRRS